MVESSIDPKSPPLVIVRKGRGFDQSSNPIFSKKSDLDKDGYEKLDMDEDVEGDVLTGDGGIGKAQRCKVGIS